jgi:4-amino-4-deoxy-L-arabinose transferase-like glycosyltransferase
VRERLRSHAGPVLLALAVVALALLVRWSHIVALPFDFHVARQYTSAQLARSYYTLHSDAPEWQKRISRARLEQEPPIEPPVFQLGTAAAYLIVGGERLWIPRLASSLFWLAGALFLYRLTRRFAPPWAAAAGVALYLFLPFPLVASTSFQPDPLMVMLLVAALLAIVRHHELPSGRRLAGAIALTAAAVLVKPGMATFFVFPVFAALAIVRRGLRDSLREWGFYLFPALGFLPAGVLYVYSALTEQFVQGRIQGSVNPALWRESYYWRGWLDSVENVLRPPFFGDRLSLVLLAVAVGAVLVVRSRAQRAVLIALWGGYALFGLVVSNYVSTHDYYSLPLVPIVSLSVAVGLGLAGERLGRRFSRRRLQAIGLSAVLVVAGAALVAKRGHLGLPIVDRSQEQWIASYKEIGRLVDHTPQALVLGGPAVWHYAWIAGRYWPGQSDLSWERDQSGLRPMGADERFRTTDDSYYPAVGTMRPPPSVFIVAEPFELALQPDLAVLLSDFRVLAESPDYVIFDLERRAAGDEAAADSGRRAGAPTFYRLPPDWSRVERGDAKDEVRRIVWTPSHTQTRTDLRKPVEVWFFGPGDKYAIVFVDGRVLAKAQRFR